MAIVGAMYLEVPSMTRVVISHKILALNHHGGRHVS